MLEQFFESPFPETFPRAPRTADEKVILCCLEMAIEQLKTQFDIRKRNLASYFLDSRRIRIVAQEVV